MTLCVCVISKSDGWQLLPSHRLPGADVGPGVVWLFLSGRPAPSRASGLALLLLRKGQGSHHWPAEGTGQKDVTEKVRFHHPFSVTRPG